MEILTEWSSWTRVLHFAGGMLSILGILVQRKRGRNMPGFEFKGK